MKQVSFEPLRKDSRYLPIKDHGLIGDGATAALVGRDGAISWMCLPHFDSSAIFCSLIDAEKGGFHLMAPEGAVESRQYYETDTGVLVTEIRSQSGHVKITDALTLRSGADLSEDTFHGRSELVRIAEVLQGEVSLNVAIEPRGGASYERSAGGLMIKPKLHDLQSLHVLATTLLESPKTTVRLHQGERFYTAMRWDEGIGRYRFQSPEAVVDDTIKTWRKWISDFTYEGPQEELVRRSAITLKLLDYTPTGAMVAAPTSSLPEQIGGTRNWDYRYAWVRDAAFSVYALRRIGLQRTAANFLGWVLDSIEKHGSPSVLYDLHGNQPPPERIDQDLEGYSKSAPVRWGNAAADQRQHDVYGEIIDCAFQWARGGGEIDPPLWSRLRALIESARSEWRTPDQGIWEVRTPGRPFTYSAALCHVALDRGVRLAEALGFPEDVSIWRSEARRIRKAILEEAWDPELHSLTEHLGKGGLDASLLSLPLRRVIPAVHPKMIATTEVISKRLGAGNGLLYRYLPDDFPDGLPGEEGAFVLCSFWLVDNLAKQGRLVEATDLYDSLCGRANSLGLLPEEIDPISGAFLGNFPQAFSHVGLISSGVNLLRQGSRRHKDQEFTKPSSR